MPGNDKHDAGVGSREQYEQTELTVPQLDHVPMYMSNNVSEMLDELEVAYERRDDLNGLSTGLDDLDEGVSGLQRSKLIVCGGRPGMGKTSLALGIARHVARELQAPVYYHSTGLDRIEVTRRILGAESEIAVERLRDGRLRDHEWQKLSQTIGRVVETGLFISDSADATVRDIQQVAKYLYSALGHLGLVIVDHIQQVDSGGLVRNAQNQLYKRLAQEIDCPVLLLAQVSPLVERRHNRRPVLSDLTRVGDLEDRADIVMMLYRDEVYDPASVESGTAELAIIKNNSGTTGVVQLKFDSASLRFSSSG